MTNLLNKVVYRQGVLLLNHPRYAYILIGLFSGVPLMTWLAVSIVALITLRKGAEAGIKALGFGLLGLFFSTVITSSFNLSNNLIIVFTFLPCFICAWLLRTTAKWDYVAVALMSFVSLLVCFFYYFPPSVLIEEYHAMEAMVRHFQTPGVQLQSMFADKQQLLAYLLGAQALSFMLATMGSLMLARSMQAKLFYPEGFKREMLSFKAMPIMVVPFSAIVLGCFWSQPLSTSLLPVWILYMGATGLSVVICLFASHRVILTTVLLLLATAFLPFFILPILILIGILDGFFNFRSRYNPPVDGIDKKKS